jgi:hypothetical protein
VRSRHIRNRPLVGICSKSAYLMDGERAHDARGHTFQQVAIPKHVNVGRHIRGLAGMRAFVSNSKEAVEGS